MKRLRTNTRLTKRPGNLCRLFRVGLSLTLLSGSFVQAATNQVSVSQPDSAFTTAPWSDPNFFPLGVWLQVTDNAERYRQAGFNTYIGLWEGPDLNQLEALKRAGLFLICAQTPLALRHRDEFPIIGWIQHDEPDNAQSWGARLGLSKPIPPATVVQEYERMKAADPSRPVLLNLGQGVAWDGWYGRGTRNNRPEDYPEYLKGCDLASFDIYPVGHTSRAVAGNLWYVARGVERLRQWTNDEKPVWNCIECTRIDNPKRKPTPHETRALVWMSLIHGSRGLIYFVHQFKPTFIEAALLEDSEMLAAVTALNRQITELAPVLNSPTITNAVQVTSDPAAPVATMVKRFGNQTYIFATAMRAAETTAKFSLPELTDTTPVEVLGENRSLMATKGVFADHFAPWDVHLYRLEVTPTR